ncbi:MAG: Do family serine endopeptidase [Parvibaculum sp.]|nr:Do family serine endopeptidase [Parvibaculum sp.]
MGLSVVRGWALAALGAVALAGLAITPAAARAVPVGLADLVQQLSSAVVNISTTYNGAAGPADDESEAMPPSPFDAPGEPGDQKSQSLGSGFVIDAKGIVVTNNHVIDGADKIEVTFTDGTTLGATLLGRDEKTDIAVLKVEPVAPLAHVALGDSDRLRVGDWVMAIGNPFGLGGSVTVGIVSALNRDIHAGNYDDFIQTDAAINRGNSGGPLFNLAGEVVGMNTAIISPSGESVGIGFATPASTISSIVQQIRTGGEIRRGWIGVRIQSVTGEIASTLGLQGMHGALVAGVAEGGPAKKAGFETGDLIVKFDGREVREMRDLPRIVAETPIDKVVKVDVIRAGKARQMSVKVGLLEEPKEASGEEEKKAPVALIKLKVLGLELVGLDDEMRERFNIEDDVQGALVAGVVPGGAASEKGIVAGDLVVRVGQVDVTSPQAVLDEVAKVKKAGRKNVLLRLLNGGSARFVALAVE